MTDIKKAFAEKQFPAFIKNHSIFKNFKEVKKVFPEIGLPNCEKEIVMDNSEAVASSAIACLLDIRYVIEDRITSLTNYLKTHPKMKMGKERKEKFDNCINLLHAVKNALRTQQKQFIITTNGKITLNLPCDILDLTNKIAFKNGEGLFRVYNKLNDALRAGKFLAMTKFEEIQTFKNFSSNNIPAVKHFIRFSSDGTEGLWDIATMSMRGIQSCQTWGNQNSTHVVGSIVDPFTGIIYLTSGNKFNEHGTKMIRRCVVRFMVNEKTKKPSIALEKMYPAGDTVALNAFISFIKEKTDNKFDVYYMLNYYNQINTNYVPMSKIVENLTAYDQPYRDSGMSYKVDVNDIKAVLRKNIEGKINTISSTIATKVLSTARVMKMENIPEKSKAAFRAFRGRNYSTYNYSYDITNLITNKIKTYFFDNLTDKFSDKNSFLKETISSFLLENIDDFIYKEIERVCFGEYFGKHCVLKSLDKDILHKITKDSSIKIEKYLTNELNKIKIIKPKSVKPNEFAEIYTKLL